MILQKIRELKNKNNIERGRGEGGRGRSWILQNLSKRIPTLFASIVASVISHTSMIISYTLNIMNKRISNVLRHVNQKLSLICR